MISIFKKHPPTITTTSIMSSSIPRQENKLAALKKFPSSKASPSGSGVASSADKNRKNSNDSQFSRGSSPFPEDAQVLHESKLNYLPMVQ